MVKSRLTFPQEKTKLFYLRRQILNWIEMDVLLKKVLSEVKPSKAEKTRLGKVAGKLLQRVNEVCKELDVYAHGMLVGSAARGTWLRSERDIDIFILFPERLSRKKLEEKGLAIARKVAGKVRKEQFAEHPYIKTRMGGFDVDLVPCYDVSNPAQIKSAVDRSPHHQRYISSRLTSELRDQVLLLKQFMMGTGVYGSDLKTQGFSGYLCELLTLQYGSFKRVIGAANHWELGEVIDPEKAYSIEGEARELFPKDPLIVIDPVDPGRNVAAALSLQNFATFVRASQDFLRKPDFRFFTPRKPRVLTPQEIRGLIKKRGTKIFSISFTTPDVVPDMLYPQLLKTKRALMAQLKDAGFRVLRSGIWANNKSVILLELSISKLPNVHARVGPPLQVDADDFVKKHLTSRRKLAGPFIDDDGRLLFEVERGYTEAKPILKWALTQRVAFGKHVARSISKGYMIHEGEEIIKLCKNKEFTKFLSEYLTLRLPWYR
jgi:tRNA nucleotidyltransferase (CCA-adding enzyme)